MDWIYLFDKHTRSGKDLDQTIPFSRSIMVDFRPSIALTIQHFPSHSAHMEIEQCAYDLELGPMISKTYQEINNLSWTVSKMTFKCSCIGMHQMLSFEDLAIWLDEPTLSPSLPTPLLPPPLASSHLSCSMIEQPSCVRNAKRTKWRRYHTTTDTGLWIYKHNGSAILSLHVMLYILRYNVLYTYGNYITLSCLS